MEVENKKTKLLILGDLESPHTQRWISALATCGYEVMAVGLNKPNETWYLSIANVKIKHLGIPREVSSSGEGTGRKLVHYLKSVPKLKLIMRSFKPDILHAHYATSYGFLASVLRFHPWICSVWGTDVYSFPQKSILHRLLFRFVLSRADQVCATSFAMTQECWKYKRRDIVVTPFGIDCEQFSPIAEKRGNNKQSITIGTIKSLESNYCIDILICAFSRVLKRFPGLPLKLLIVGEGSQRPQLEALVAREGVSNCTTFVGHVPHKSIVKYYRMLSIYVAVSKSESFGVAVLEASACGIPVIVSNVGGLPEVVRDGETGLVVPPSDVEATAEAIEMFVTNPSLQDQMGEEGRRWVLERYNWKRSVDIMSDVYLSVSR